MDLSRLPMKSPWSEKLVCRFQKLFWSRSWPLNRGYLKKYPQSNTPDLKAKTDSESYSETGKPYLRSKCSNIGWFLSPLESTPSSCVVICIARSRFPDLHMDQNPFWGYFGRICEWWPHFFLCLGNSGGICWYYHTLKSPPSGLMVDSYGRFLKFPDLHMAACRPGPTLKSGKGQYIP